MAGEIRIRGFLAACLVKPLHLDGQEIKIIEIIEPSPSPAAPLPNGKYYEFTGRLDTHRNPLLYRSLPLGGSTDVAPE